MAYMRIVRQFVDWEATGNKLFNLRRNNEYLRRYVCSMLRKDTIKCTNIAGDCETCTFRDMDNSISCPELAEVFGVSSNVINNWEKARSHISIENLLFYCQIAHVKLDDIVVVHN